MIRLLIFGPTGSMGRLITKLAIEDDEIEVVGACDVKEIHEPLDKIIRMENGTEILINRASDLEEVIKRVNPDVAVDFTNANATEENCPICLKNGVRCVIGTTGLSNVFLQVVGRLVKEHDVPVVISTNMAPGVNVLFKMASLLARYLEEWDIEIIESHHSRKVDSPSGTGITLGELISKTLGVEFDDVIRYGRGCGPNKRKVGAKREIGIHAIRAGDIIGDHVILYAGKGERIELKHQAHGRECFASGAIKAIKFIASTKESKIHASSEVLGIE